MTVWENYTLILKWPFCILCLYNDCLELLLVTGLFFRHICSLFGGLQSLGYLFVQERPGYSTIIYSHVVSESVFASGKAYILEILALSWGRCCWALCLAKRCSWRAYERRRSSVPVQHEVPKFHCCTRYFLLYLLDSWLLKTNRKLPVTKY